jgi:DNA-binding transcriptional MerR regulator
MYTILQFARLADVTVKALRHYERVELLVPVRTAARHRRYTVGDLPRLERILALRTLGLPLAVIREVLAGDLARLPARLTALEDLRARWDHAIEVLRTIDRHERPSEALDRFVDEATWIRWERLRQLRASGTDRAPDRAGASRLALFLAIDSARATDPDGPELRRLIRRWHETTAPEIRESVRRRAGWPPGMRTYIASLYNTTPEAWERVVAVVEALEEVQPER